LRPRRTIEERLKVEAGKLIFGQLSDVGCEGVRIAGFKLGKGIQVALGRGVIVFRESERLESAERLGLTL
jgi:hypothetical protein